MKLQNLVRSFTFNYKTSLPLFWFTGTHNFGDAINPYIVSKISNKKVIHINPKYFFNTHYLCIGSIMDKTQKHSIIWGAGFISQDSKVKKPKKVYAVRGPKSRSIFLQNNIECPEVYGDPALLLPKFYTPSFQKKYKYGIVPHYVDKELVQSFSQLQDESIQIIDIQQENFLNFIEELSQCETIISSSLHGLIVSDAYGINNIWAKFSNNVKGDDFKFYDYFESIQRLNEKPCFINENTTLEEIQKHQNTYTINIDLDKLLANCPFSK